MMMEREEERVDGMSKVLREEDDGERRRKEE
jgi:hypothetical protein